MTDERLKEIQDNINERNMFPNRMYIFREEINDEEQELVNEIEKLQRKIYNAIEYLNEYRDGWSNWFEFTIDDKLKLIEILRSKQ